MRWWLQLLQQLLLLLLLVTRLTCGCRVAASLGSALRLWRATVVVVPSTQVVVLLASD
jgi:hypothetical protein